MSDYSSGNNTLNVTGGGNQFVVVYKYAGAADGSGGPPEGVQAQFGAAGSLNNTDPNYDFASLDNGKVYTIDSGSNDMTIEGGNKQFVVEYVVPSTPDASADLGGNTVTVEGGNNAFVVAYEYAPGAKGSGNTVSVDGGNNAFVVAYNTSGNAYDFSGLGASGSDMSAGGSDQQQGAGLSGNNNAGVAIGAQDGNTVSVNGDNNQYVIQYGSSGSGADSAGANPFGGNMSGAMGGNPFGGGMGGAQGGAMSGNPFGGAGGDASGGMMGGMGGGMMGGMGGGMSGDDATAFIAQSPFGRLLGLPGINSAADIFGNLGGGDANPFGDGAAAGGAGAGGNPFAGAGGAGGNPFAGAGGAGGNPFGGAGGAQPAGGMNAAPADASPSSDPAYVYDFGASEAEAPAAGGAGGNPFAGAGGGAGGGNPFAGGAMPGGAAGGGAAGGGASGGAAPAGGDLNELFKASPFGALLQIPGINGIEDIFGSDGGAAGSPFSGGNPFAGVPGGGAPSAPAPDAAPAPEPDSNPDYAYDFSAEDGEQMAGAAPAPEPDSNAGGGGDEQMAGAVPMPEPDSNAGGADAADDGSDQAAGAAPMPEPDSNADAAGGNDGDEAAPAPVPTMAGNEDNGDGSVAGMDVDALFAASPFGPLLDIPGINGPEDIFGANGAAGGSPFAASDSNPFADPEFAANLFASFQGGANPDLATMIADGIAASINLDPAGYDALKSGLEAAGVPSGGDQPLPGYVSDALSAAGIDVPAAFVQPT